MSVQTVKKLDEIQIKLYHIKYKKIEGVNMYDNWEELEKSIENCSKCKLYKTRQNIVFGVGNKQARIMFIGEGPGADEDRLRRAICRKSRKANEPSI